MTTDADPWRKRLSSRRKTVGETITSLKRSIAKLEALLPPDEEDPEDDEEPEEDPEFKAFRKKVDKLRCEIRGLKRTR